MPTTSSSDRAVLSPALLVLAATGALFTGTVAVAGPAAALEDPRRPTAEVTHGPSCGPGVVRVAVTNGTRPHRVALVFDGTAEQAVLVLGGGEQAELASPDVDWGHTVDVSVAVTDTAGTVEDPIELGTYTRPSAGDCAAVTPTLADAGSSPQRAPTSSGTTTAGSPSSTGPTPTGPTTASAPGTSGSTAPASTVGNAAAATSGQAGTSSAASVSPGGVVTVRATGFNPGEPVTVSMLGVGDPLTTVTAGGDGSVEAVVQIPRGAALGTATVQLVGGLSDASAGLDLQVAARSRPVAEQATSIPVRSAGTALLGAAAMLGLRAARRSRGHHTMTPR